MKVKKIVLGLTKYLDCTPKALCSLLGVTETALSAVMDKSVANIKSKTSVKRLMKLLYVVETLIRDKSLTPIVIKKVLVTPCFRRDDGSYVAVISAIHDGTIPNEFLIPIADATLKRLRKNYDLKNWPIEDGLYNSLK